MSQQINLINPALIKQKNLLTSVNMSMAYGLLMACMFGLAAYTASQVSALTASKQQLVTEQEKLQAELAQLTAARAPRAPNQAFVAQLALLESKEKVQMQIFNIMSRDHASQTKSLASYMRGLARQSMDGLWLTGFNIDQSHHAVTLRGRALQAEVLPDYMRKLGQEPVFSGQLFGGLQIKQAEKTAAKVLSPTSNTAPATSDLPFVEFELQGLEKPAQNNTENNAENNTKSNTDALQANSQAPLSNNPTTPLKDAT